MSKYQHIIWDWNGTLLDDAWLCVEIMNQQLAIHDLPDMSLADYAAVFRFPVRDYYADLGFDFGRTSFESLSDFFILHYDSRKGECALREGGLAALQKTHQNGVSQSIISASEHNSLIEIVGQHGIRDLFSGVHGIDNHHAAGKTEIGLQWIAEADIDPKSALFIGDTTHDYEVAAAMGVDCILLTSGHQTRTRLETCGVPVVDKLADIDI